MPSRSLAISAYSPAFSKGAKVYGANIQSGVVTSAHIADGTIVAADVGAGSITSAKIGAAAVTSAKIGTGAVVAVKIGAAAVTSAKIGAAAVVASKVRLSVVSGTVASDNAVFAVAHGLSATPSVVVVTMKSTAAKLNQSASACVGEVLASVSARTSTNVYLAGSAGTGYSVLSIV